MVVAKWAGLSSLDTADLTHGIFTHGSFQGGQRRMTRLVWALRMSIVTLIITLYNCDEQKSILECRTYRTSKWMCHFKFTVMSWSNIVFIYTVVTIESWIFFSSFSITCWMLSCFLLRTKRTYRLIKGKRFSVCLIWPWALKQYSLRELCILKKKCKKKSIIKAWGTSEQS